MNKLLSLLCALLLLSLVVGVVGASTVINTTASKGGVFNGGFETGTGTQTGVGWIGSENYGWYSSYAGTGIITMFDANVSHSGSKSFKYNATSALSDFNVIQYPGGTVTVATLGKYGIEVKPSTTYKISFWIKSDGGKPRLIFDQYDSSAVLGTETVRGTAGTYDWTLDSVTITTDSDAKYEVINVGTTGTGISSYWIDDITLEEVVQDTYTGTSVQVKPVIQGVTSVDNIDQSSITNNTANGFGAIS